MEATVTRAFGIDPHGYVDKLLIVDKSTPMPYEVFYRGADKSLARPRRKQATATKL